MEFTGQDAIAIVAIAIAMVKIFTGPIGAAIGERIRGHALPVEDPALTAEVEDRLDFAERLLAQAREADQLHGGAQR